VNVDLGWPHRRCILCCRELADDLPFSRAHLIPESIGGFAWAWTKCKKCNELAGSSIEGAVVKDPSIVSSVHALRDELPDLARKFAERTRWVAHTEHGPIEARLRDGAFRLLTTKDEDGARRQSSDDARDGLEKRLRREKRTAEEIVAALSLFDNAQKGVPVEIHGETFVHGESPGTFGLPFDGPPVSEAFPSLIAFHFLALGLGEQVYDERLNPLRKAIRNGESRSAWHVAEGGIARRYEPAHLVGFAQCKPHVVVRVQLFGWSIWRVHFPRIASRSEPLGLHFDLKTETISLAAPRLNHPLAIPNDP
jgi:HNH endonuclease